MSTPSASAAATGGGGGGSSSNVSKSVISAGEWNQRLATVDISDEDLNKLVMNYLVVEGYTDAAKAFSSESGIALTSDTDPIERRMSIRSSIQTGNIPEAIEKINDLNPEILDVEPTICFRLHLQYLIELIRNGQTLEAIQYAQEELAPRGESNPELLPELEDVMALLAFDTDDLSGTGGLPQALRILLDFAQRQQTANELNSAILKTLNQPSESKLPALVKLLSWSQSQLDDRAIYPRLNDITSGELVVQSQSPQPPPVSSSSEAAMDITATF
ncbi:hypothetical protein GQ42DRAFT_170766 [Ramicandelaber brevisporus]|nr:hypothetical protein GQ42DRAFT_170766 [Ramicandelaber brevisporus]